jgi:hypothetical protein
VVDTWDTHSREDMVERVMLPMRSRNGGICVQDVGDAHAVRYSWWFGGRLLKNHLALWKAGFRPSLASKLSGDSSDGNRIGTWSHHGGCVDAKQLCVERVTVRSKLQELVHFSLG